MAPDTAARVRCVCGAGCDFPIPKGWNPSPPSRQVTCLDRPTTTAARLLPNESLALTVALAQVRRGEEPQPNTAAMCVLALARLDGRYDWTQEATDG